MSRVAVAIFIITFWLAFPVLAGYLDIGVKELRIEELETEPDTEGLFGSQYTAVKDSLSVYFNLLTMTIPGVPLFMRFIVWSLQAVSILVVYLLLRG